MLLWQAEQVEGANDSANDTGINESMDETMETTNADDTVADVSPSLVLLLLGFLYRHRKPRNRLSYLIPGLC